MKIYLGNKHHIAAYLASVHEFGEIPEDIIHFSARANSFHMIFWKLLGFSTARYWTGNDAWRFNHSWSYRVRARLINRFFDRHYFLGEHLSGNRWKYEWGKPLIVRNLKTSLCYKNRKPGHRQVNEKPVIGYYHCEQTFPDRYGLKAIERLKKDLGDTVEWFPIYPGDWAFYEMEDQVYRQIDIMVRPSFWDGYDPFMIREATHFGVKCVSTFSLCSEVLKCDPNDYEDILTKVKSLL